jgi:acyl-CoA synthetase (AMP-forming)/AMP-acid ligase II
VAQGYWNNQEATRERFRPNPFQPKELAIPELVVYSGDYVRKDEDGFLYFIGRKDEMIKSAGNRISPEEVEEIIYSSGLVSAVIAFGFPDDLYGQSVFVIVSALNQKQLDLNEFKKFCHNNMPSYMIPKFIEIWDSLPKNPNGKIDRSKIKNVIFKKFHILNEEKPLTK